MNWIGYVYGYPVKRWEFQMTEQVLHVCIPSELAAITLSSAMQAATYLADYIRYTTSLGHSER